MDEPSPSSGLANVLMLVGLALLVVGGIAAYPSLSEVLAYESAPRGFGDEVVYSAAIVEARDTVPRPPADTAPAPAVLPETPLQSDRIPSPEPTASPAILPETPLQVEPESPPEASPEPSPEPTATPIEVAEQPATPIAPTAAPSASPAPSSEFIPDVPTRLVIPAIQLDAPVETVGWQTSTQGGQQVSMWQVPNRRAAGWLKTSARVGDQGNMVLDGHHNMSGEVFRNLVDLKQGDLVQVWSGDRAREYVVVLQRILKEKGEPIATRLDNAKWILPTDDERVTLVTCWPYTNNTHRLIVVAIPADAPAGSGAE